MDYAAPAMYRATRPQPMHFSVTCERGGGGALPGSRSIDPEHEGQLSASPLRSLAMRWRACAGLYEFGRGFRMRSPAESNVARSVWRDTLRWTKANQIWAKSKWHRHLRILT